MSSKMDSPLRERMKAAIAKEAREDRGDNASAVYGGMADAAISTLTLSDHIAAVEAAGISDAEIKAVAKRLARQNNCALVDWRFWINEASELITAYRAALAARPRDAE